MFFSYVYSVI